MTELPKTFDPAAIETRWYAHWEENGLFRPERPDATPFTIVNPPPNVTGSLHIGHALDNTLQDIVIRYERLRGKDALWVVGTDHAGIATQMVVERQMEARQDKRSNYTRDQFVEKVWEWKAESGGAITRQLRRLGCSMDWANERFTMDEGFSKAVAHVFVELHKRGLLYRDKRLVNWDPGLGTAISDLEVETREVQGKFWHLRYPLADGAGHISVATTRPETMLADMAVAVHPDDERYRTLVGRQVRLPITGRLIPIVADEHADPALGSGAVKITPGHDFNDFEVGRRAGIEARDMLNMLDARAHVTQVADGSIPAGLLGLERFAARKAVVAQLDAEGWLERVEDRVIQTPYGDRSGVVIEPWLTDQWYVDAKTLAQPAIEAVRSGAVKIVPKSWEKTYFNWMENIQPWCVSRQLWWGHRIPAWFADDGRVFVAETYEAAQAEAGEGVALKQDEDVLDTWFSSALWPFATLGWPENTDPTLGGRYSNDVLISGFDILFFWDARMLMQGIHFMKEVPFKTLYLHGLVRAADGAKMSKSKGNVIDPLDLVEKYGADALRFTLAAMAAQGRDIKLATSRVEGYRNFATKLWNAARFAEMNECRRDPAFDPRNLESTLNRWIVSETQKAGAEITAALEAYKFNEAAGAAYRFVWNIFCDWYLELAKPVFMSEAGGWKGETRTTTAFVLDEILKLLHPFMPFLTEELWARTAETGAPREGLLVLAPWPKLEGLEAPEAEAEIGWLIDIVTEIRSVRAEMNVPAGAQIPLVLVGAGEAARERVIIWHDVLTRLARLSAIAFELEAPAGSVQIVVRDQTVALPLAGIIDMEAEAGRLAKELAKATDDIAKVDAKLGNADFIKRAPEEVIEEQRERRETAAARAAKIREALTRLGKTA